MDDLYGIWIPEDFRYFMLFLSSSNSYFIISKNPPGREQFGTDNLAIEWGSYGSSFIVNPNDFLPRVALMDFSRQGCYGTDRDIRSQLQTYWTFTPPTSEIYIQDGLTNKLVRCQSIEFAPIKL
jgi:hypothetical protein